MPSTERFYLGLPEGLMGGKQSSLLGTDTPHGGEQALRGSSSGVSTRQGTPSWEQGLQGIPQAVVGMATVLCQLLLAASYGPQWLLWPSTGWGGTLASWGESA